MAKQQYRVSGELNWTSNSGNALFAIVNKAGSGKKVTLKSLEITPKTTTTTGTAGTVSAAAPTFMTVGRATVAGGEAQVAIPTDTSATSWPSTARILKQATVASATAMYRISVSKQLNQASLSWMGRQTPGRFGAIMGRPGKDTGTEGLIVRAAESIALYPSTFNNSVPLRVTATIVRTGTPNRTWSVSYFTSAQALDVAIFALVNDSGSGETFIVRNLAVEEVGTYDSPYLQLVPSGGLIESTVSKLLVAMRMDTAYPDPATFVELRADCPMFPFGQYENAFADGSTGSPRGFNYLKTKDFLGPVYRTVFPEYVQDRPTFMPDVWGCGQRMTDPMIKRSGITLREGEGLALVSAAETAAGATSAVGVSGWSSFEFAATFSLEPALIPTIGITGMIENSRYRVERVSDSSLVFTGVADNTGATSFLYETEDTPLNLRLKVRKASAAPFYKPYEILFSLTSAGISVPVSQTLDT